MSGKETQKNATHKDNGDFAKNNKLGGRKKGVPNSLTKEGRELFLSVIEGKFPEFEKKLMQIDDPKDWCMVFLKACEFGISKANNVNIQTNDDSKVQVFIVDGKEYHF